MGGSEVRKIAHIINPVKVAEMSDLFIAQPVTFTTMATARDFAHDKVNVALYTAQYPEDRTIIPPEFQMTPDLERSILDLGFFQKKRKLPLIKDILDRLYNAATDADYLIYTNVDIALQPHFYVAVNTLIEQDCDAFVINRRTISKKYTRVEDIPLMCSEIGEGHWGWDCFIFKRSAYSRFILGEICIGANFIGAILLFNLLCYSNKFKEFKDKHLTFHLGDDMTWKSSDYSDYSAHNTREAARIYEALEHDTKGGITKDGRYNSLVKWMRKVKNDLDTGLKASQVKKEAIAPTAALGKPQDRQRIFCITGVARGGTSMIARIVNLMGVYFGPENHMIQETKYNVKGCWEHKSLLEISESIRDILSVKGFQQDWVSSPNIVELEHKARAVIIEDFNKSAVWGWKDDRCSLTLPFWQKILQEMEYIICIRNPVDVARSLFKMGWSDSITLGLITWLLFISSAIKNTRGKRRIIVFYEDFLDKDWKNAVKSLSDFLGPSHAERFSEYEKEIENFVERGLQHHNTSMLAILSNVEVPYVVKHFYFMLHSLVKGKECDMLKTFGGDPEAIIDTLALHANDEAYRKYDTYFRHKGKDKLLSERDKQLGTLKAEIDSLSNSCNDKNSALETTRLMLDDRDEQLMEQASELEALKVRIDDLLNSYSWKLTAPLRKTLDILMRSKNPHA